MRGEPLPPPMPSAVQANERNPYADAPCEQDGNSQTYSLFVRPFDLRFQRLRLGLNRTGQRSSRGLDSASHSGSLGSYQRLADLPAMRIARLALKCIVLLRSKEPLLPASFPWNVTAPAVIALPNFTGEPIVRKVILRSRTRVLRETAKNVRGNRGGVVVILVSQPCPVNHGTAFRRFEIFSTFVSEPPWPKEFPGLFLGELPSLTVGEKRIHRLMPPF